MLRVCFFIKALSEASGGAERVLSTVASKLAERGHQVTIVTSDKYGTTPFYQINPKVRIVRLQVGDAHRHLNLYTLLSTSYRYYQILRHGAYDVTVGFMHSAFIPLSIPSYLVGIPVIGSEHISFDHYQTRRMQLWLYKLVIPFLDAVTVLSDAVKRNFPDQIARRMYVVPNPVSLDEVRPVDGGIQKTRNIILSVGRLDIQKDHATLISAFAKCADQFPDWDLHIYGRGKLHGPLQDQIEGAGLQGRIYIHPPTANICTVYATADIMAVPSRYESFGLVTVEAMLCGLPVIGFADCPGTNELIEDGKNGVLVQGADRAESFKNGLVSLMSNPDRRLQYGLSGRETAKRFHPDAIVTLWERILEQVLSTSRRLPHA